MPTPPPRKIFVNLPVRDLRASVAFFTALGFGFDARFTDETATCMVVNDDAFVMLLVERRFADFTTKAICDATTSTEAIIALSADSRAEVDDLVHRALAAGGTARERSHGPRVHVRLELPGSRRAPVGARLHGAECGGRTRRGIGRRGEWPVSTWQPLEGAR